MYILGIHFGSHNTSASLLKDGKIIAFAEQERFNHQKYTDKFPQQAIYYCLEDENITFNDLDYIAYATDPEVTNKEKLEYIKKYRPDFQPAMINTEDVQQQLRDILNIKKDSRVKLKGIDHHMAHAASCFLNSPYEEATVVTIDGMGNWITASINIGQGNKINRITYVSHPHSLGLFYGAITQFLGFKAIGGESKMMGLASYGKPTFYNEFKDIVKVNDGYKIVLNLDYFTFHKLPLKQIDGTLNRWYSDNLIKLLGPVRIPESDITKRYEDIAQSAQKVLEERVITMLNYAYQQTGSKNLCLAGGVALNCSMNGKIRANTPFENIYISPIVNDAGLSMGSALYVYNVILDKPRNYVLRRPYLGPSFSNKDILNCLRKRGQGFQYYKDIAKRVAHLIADDKIVGWFQGRMEAGPRALGNRSILADARNPKTKDTINSKVKFRESFRPFAPAVIEEDTSDYFDLNSPSPFMLQAVKVKRDKRGLIPSVVHIDKTSRVQTVKKEENPLFWQVLHEFKRLTGVPIILNTSLNIRGDTIACTPDDAIDTFLKSQMDCLVLGNYLLMR